MKMKFSVINSTVLPYVYRRNKGKRVSVECQVNKGSQAKPFCKASMLKKDRLCSSAPALDVLSFPEYA